MWFSEATPVCGQSPLGGECDFHLDPALSLCEVLDYHIAADEVALVEGDEPFEGVYFRLFCSLPP
jgi:hypothetical protein